MNLRLAALSALWLVCASCSSKPAKTTTDAKSELPPLQALPSQSLKGLNIQIPPSISPSAKETNWIEFERERIAFSDSFSEIGGFECQLSNGRYSEQGIDARSRMFAIFASPDAVGSYSLSMREEPQSIGPDGKSGVMSVSLVDVPEKLGYFTFVYWGKVKGNAFNLASIVNAKSTDDLNGIQFRFRYKGSNGQSSEKINFAFDFRLGFEGDVYENRLDLGRITVTDQWQNHIVDIGHIPNAKNFLESVASLSERPLRLEISQVGSVDGYRSGDTLTIDDIEVVVPQRIVDSMTLR